MREIRLICMLATEVVVTVFGLEVFVNADRRNKMHPDRPDKWCNTSALAVL